jgi:aminopeptidase N
VGSSFAPAVLSVCFLLLFLHSPAWTDTYPKNPDIDILHYTFRLTLSDSTDEIVGETTVDLRFLRPGVSEFALDLVKATPENEGRGMTVSALTSDRGPVRYEHDCDRIRLLLPAPPEAGQRTRFKISYRGLPAAGLRIGLNKHGERCFFSDNWPDKARHWLPTLDHPSDKATCEMIVSAPAHYQVVSNGLLQEETDLPDNLRRTHWRQSVPIATWLYDLGVARFAVDHALHYEHIPIQTWVYARDRDAGFYDFAVPARDVLAFYSDWIGPYSYEKLANVQAASVRGGMEAATAIFYGEESVTGRRDIRWRNVVIHEIAHHWFGNSVTEADWDDVWLSEGFATYFTSLFIEYAYGHDEFIETMKRARDSVGAFAAKTPNYRLIHDNLADMSRVTTSQHYQKGAWILHMLRGFLGTEKFQAGIRQYYALYQNKNATTADFERVIEEISNQDLKWFFQQWLYQPGGLPKLKGGWRYDPEKRRVIVELEQTQTDGAFYRLPVEVGLNFGEDQEPRRERIDLTGRSQVFEIAADRAPVSVVLDPDLWVLMDAEFPESPAYSPNSTSSGKATAGKSDRQEQHGS